MNPNFQRVFSASRTVPAILAVLALSTFFAQAAKSNELTNRSRLNIGEAVKPPIPTAGKTARTIVSLAPSNTELIYSLGSEAKLVGVSSYCTYPPDTRTKQKVGSFVSINWERMAVLKPDVVLLVSGQEPLAIQLKKHNLKAVVLKNNSLNDVAKNLLELGSILACEKQAKLLADSYSQAIARLQSVVQKEPRRKVLFCVWPKPIVTVGGDSFLNDVITTCGGINVTADIKVSYPKCSPEKILAAQPDLIVMPYESRNTKLSVTPPWSLLSAVRKNRVYFLPERQQDFLSRPTLRIFKGLYEFAAQLHPDRRAQLKAWLASVDG